MEKGAHRGDQPSIPGFSPDDAKGFFGRLVGDRTRKEGRIPCKNVVPQHGWEH